MSSLFVAKHLKSISIYAESKILQGLTEFSPGEIKQLRKIAKRLTTALQSVDKIKINTRQKVKKQNPTKKDVLAQVILKIEKVLTEYEISDKIDNWRISFQVGVNYEELSIDEIVSLHKDFLTSTISVDKIKSFLFGEKDLL